ncbi:tripartite tricarboxylate transporter permease [Sulfitobacter pseudonitzschiae]|uniref:Tripartite tricarboxylate transporter permease n=1 Tax=Pseudosulfitobacter pseudonitzschiae TaxID=1402135 RepID=A0A9Q2NLI4_9RHOB|nr:tripartite tricarboxylate transporter permease [Pseudosulfitobacter pseudonitzschiae]MBM2291766.1 tripartite tricarboxylate transporter permease [Pseudosulfitobacter pseudonitzschiae]MBM2296684.1 tripartite tricarboxylate transporter permease [Pseudosulfitobacter pseudonitzschiae]MBM2301597.1 tripartite tricarboxylate transporter permease [Pseudosulfitobacter pseudonitzschiae]MBM2311380.1 tripartite tricarboxylate transporter permease [Pseudosulfitobacter pseudonitzschiae]MBM2316294.1 tripa
MEFYTNALSHVLTFGPLTAMIGATLLGVFIGALPGLNPVMAIALLLPLTYSMDPLVALAMVAGIYNGSMYGGAIPAILLRIPGTPASIATTFDGFPMADRGEASKALKIACWSSAIGGIASAIALMTMGPMLARVTLFFGPAEYFWIAIFGMASVAVMVGSDPVKGIMAAVLGLLIGTIGIDNLSGQARFTFGQTWLLGGLDLIVVLVGLYALPPVLQLAEKCDLRGLSAAQLKLADVPFKKGEVRGLIPTWLRASGIGIGVGILPGAGGNIAAFLSYNAAKNASDDPSSFGKGNPQGVAAAECGNNADNAASMIPALALGIPGNVVAALVLSALTIHGLQPGPQLFHQNPTLVGGFMMEMLITSVLIFALGGAVATRVFAQFQRLPGVLLVPTILILMCVGVYVINGHAIDLWVMLAAGFAGYFLEKVNFPLAPVILGMILGPMAEQSVRRALLISRGDVTELVTRPISAVLAAVTVLVIVWPLVKMVRRRRKPVEH